MAFNFKTAKPSVFRSRNKSTRKNPVTGPSNMAKGSRNPSGSPRKPARQAASRNPKGDMHTPHAARTEARRRAKKQAFNSLYEEKRVDWPKGRNKSQKQNLSRPYNPSAKTRIKSMRGANARGKNKGSNAGGR